MCRKFIAVLLILAFLVPAGCSGQPEKAETNAQLPEKTIAVAELFQETNVALPSRMVAEDFVITRGDDMLALAVKTRYMVGGFLDAVKQFGKGRIKVVPIFSARGDAGPNIDRATYDSFKKEILDGLRGMKNLDGIYLSLHGSMGVDGLWDPEGDLLQSIRSEFGTSVPIATTYDLHANMTEKKATLATIIVGFKTNPHRDMYAAGFSAGKILIKTVFGEVHPTMTVNKLKVLRGGGQIIDFLEPMDRVFNRMAEMEKMPGVLSVSNFLVHIWLDEPGLGWGTVAITDNDKALAGRLADEIAERDWAVRDFKMTQKLYSPSEAIKAARDSWFERLTGTTMFCDLSDAIGAGAPGESTYILKALVEEGPDLVSYLTVRDEAIVKELWDVPLNQTVTITVGGKLDKQFSLPYKYTGQVIYKGNARGSNKSAIKCVIVRNNGVHLILTDYPDPTMSPSFFTSLGLDMWKADIVVAKNLFPFRIWYLKYNRKTINVLTPGTTNIDVYQIKYNNITRPIYPFDQLDSWKWEKWSNPQ